MKNLLVNEENAKLFIKSRYFKIILQVKTFPKIVGYLIIQKHNYVH